MKSIVMLALTLSSAFAFATPGDISCTGKLNGKNIELLLGYDTFEQTVPSLLSVSQDGVVVFESSAVSGTSRKSVYVASDEESSAKVTLKNQKAVLTVTSDSGPFKAKNLKLNCEM